MRGLKILLAMVLISASSLLMAEEKKSMPEECAKLLGALEACDAGAEGPFGTIRKICKSAAESEFKCNIPIEALRADYKRYKK